MESVADALINSTRILVVEDLEADYLLAQREIRKAINDCVFHHVDTHSQFLDALETFKPDVILSDYNLPQFNGMKALAAASQHAPLTPFIIWTGSISEDTAVECMRAGANNYIIKENIKRLGPAVAHALAERQLRVEQKQAEETIHNQEKHFRALIENSLENISLLAEDGTLLWENPAVNRTLGYDQDVYVGRNIFELMHPNDLSKAREKFARLLQNPGEHERDYFRLLHHDGSWRWVEGVARNLLNEPAVKAIVINYRDITERMQAEESLRKSERRLNLAVDATNLGVWEWNFETNTVYWSENSYQITGALDFDQTLDGFVRLLHPDDAQRVMDQVQDAIANNKTFIAEFRMNRPDGKEIWVRNYGQLEFDENQKPINLVGTVEDITERKMAEAARLESEKRFQGLFENTPVAIWEEDFSQLKKHLDQLRKQGVNDFHTYFEANPGALNECASMIKVLDVNTSALKIYEAESKEVLIAETNRVLTTGEQEHNLDDFVAIVEGKTVNTWEGGDQTLTGRPIEISLTWSVVPGYESDYSRVIVTTVDITEIKESERKLRESDERFRQLADNIQEVFWMTDAVSGRELYISPASEKIWGRPLNEFLDEPNAFVESLVEEDRAGVLRKIEQQRTGESTAMEYRIRHKDGSIRWIWDRAFPIFDDSGNVVRLAGIAADITQRKEAEQKLRESEERFRQLADNIQDVFWMFNTVEGEKIYHSPASQRVYGFTPDDMPENPDELLERILPEDRPLVIGKFSDQQNGRETEMEYRIHHTDGSIRWIWDRAFPVFDENGRMVRLAGIASDITERKQAENALRESQIRFAGVVNTAMDAVISIDSDQNINLFNPAAERMFKCDAKDAIGKPIGRFIPDRYRAFHEKHIQNFGRTGATNRAMGHLGVLYGLRGDGSEFPIEASISHIESNGQQIFTVILRDITERKKAEEALRQSEERYRELLNTSPVGILVHVNGNIVFANSSLAQIVGAFTSNELLEDPLREFVNYDDSGIRKILNGESESKVYPYETSFTRFDGSSVDVELIATKLSYAGRPAVQVVVQDITVRKQAEQEVDRHLAEMQALYENGLALGRLLKPQEIGQRIIKTFSNYLSWHHVTIRLLKSGSDELELVAYSLPDLTPDEIEDAGQNFVQRINRIGQGMSGWVAQTGQPIRSGNVREHSQYLDVYEDIQSGLYMPLKIGDKVVGVISVESEAPDAFTVQDERLLATLASQAAIAFENARLYHSIEEERQGFVNLFENTPVATWLEDFSDVFEWMASLKANGVTSMKEYLSTNPDELKTAVNSIHVLNVNQAAVALNAADNKMGLVGAAPELMIDSVAREIMIEEFERLWNGETSFEFEMASKRIDGSTVTNILRLFVPVSLDGKTDIRNVIVTSTNISERVEMEKALRTSEAHYRELADSITDIFFELDNNLRYSYWNKASEELTGVLAKDAMGKSMREIFGDTREQMRIEAIYKDVLSSHQPRTFETKITLGGVSRSFEIAAYPSTRGVSVVAKDVTERKRVEVILQKRFELMEFSAHHTLDELMQKTVDEICDINGSKLGLFHFIEEDQNALGAQVWSTGAFPQFDIPEGVGMHLALDQAGVWADAARQRRALIQNNYNELPAKKELPSGHTLIHREMVIPIIRNEKIMAVIGVANKESDYTALDLETMAQLADYAWDITERKRMATVIADERNQLAKRVDERTAELARALRVKDEFLASMSHELRTPLNAILGLSESLAEQIAGPLNEKQFKYITTISESGHHLLSLINDILDLAKIEAGQITLDINKVDVNAVCEASIRMVKELASKKHQQLTIRVDREIGLMWADERRLKQMLVNLLSNAVKFTPENGELGLDVHGSQTDGQIEFSVWDNGIGIESKNLSRLFQPFVQLDSGLARESTGTGLGLALVAQMARLHGGSVAVNSEPGLGSRFTILLPWEPVLSKDVSPKLRNTGGLHYVAQQILGSQKKILLVEDTEEVVMTIKDYLEMSGYEVITAQDGVEGVDQALLTHPDLILMDIQMPHMDGIEATKRLRVEKDFKYVPIIALTAQAMPNDRERCLAAGMDEYITKPVNLKGLVAIIKRCLSESEQKTRPM